ncbi:hypothetical protein LWI29_032437 [Acer saccharum]|uniref:Prolamin-like domain-containing protein n=1 Tax=Acer saccharum TaxID=4024 RepID=A0AA39SW48_ACESA|nr:hypothetical protein LWI29_032437 [Acer saccharum]
MASKTVFLCLVLTFLVANTTSSRDLPANNIPGHNLVARLEASGGLVECWNALLEVKSCSNEIILFFLNGQANIGPDCCRSIAIITRNCLPVMLTSLGFTAEEGNILRGYCDASPSPMAVAPLPATSSPSPSPLSV